MRFSTFALAAALSFGLNQTGDAYAPQKGAEPPVVANGRAPRLHRDVTWTAPQPLTSLPSWRVLWDRDTDVPLRLWGPSLAAPRASSDPAAAEASARQFLASHLHLLAPGAQPADFVLVANQTDPSGRLRTVAFAQHAHGLPVVGGAIGFAFSHDRLVVMSSTALPDVAVRLPGAALPVPTIASAATSWLAQSGYAVDVRSRGERVIVPIVRSRGTATKPDITYRVAETVTVESTREAGLWDVWIDANDASPIARHSMLHFASGTILFDTPDRWPFGPRSPKPALNATHTIDGMPITSTLDGTLTWAGDGSASVTTGIVGPLVRVSTKAGTLLSEALTLAPNGTVTISKATEEYGDAQLTSFVAASMAKQFAKTRLNPTLNWLNSQIPVVVNEQQTCNAYSTGNAIHFFKSDTKCGNTGRLVDVVYHEFGHSLHRNSIIPGQGSWDGSLSEGLADTFAASITDDHGMGRGFFHSNEPLRDLDPAGYEKVWPDDADGEVHNEGEIIGGALWDMRKALEAKLGAAAGKERTLKIFYSIMQRASDIPSSYIEALLADDDDGNLDNGTPNQCEIDATFAPHGLTDPSLTLGLLAPTRDGYQVSFSVQPPTRDIGCPPPTITTATVTWAPRGGFGGVVPLDGVDNTYSANIPTQPDGTVVLYSVQIKLSDGSSIRYPQNAADPEYQFYAGNVMPLWCADFEAGLGDWTVGGTTSSKVEWEAGAPMGIAGDPTAAHGGSNVLGTDLGSNDGLYESRVTQWAETPEIDLQGTSGRASPNVRLQYWRWLNVEDGVFDPATITANDQTVWNNHTSPDEESKGLTHADREWRFHDVDLSAQTTTGKLKLKFAITSDPGLELAGWNIDDVCIVIAGPPTTTCGNHNLDGEEACDDGNSDDGDGCSATCALEDGGGCCSAGTNPAGPLALSLLTFVFVVRRRKRARAGE